MPDPRTARSGARPHIEAVITNHNTSALAEVALLSLVRATRGLDRATLRITVTDNWSTDNAVDRLRRTAGLVGAAFVTTRWPHAGAAAAVSLDSEGDVWRDFVMAHDDCDYYLFVDSDVELTDERTIEALLDVYDGHDDIWAACADSVRSDCHLLDPGAERLPALDDVIEMTLERAKGGRHGRSRKVFYGLSHPRTPSVCTLVARTDYFVKVARVIGISPTAVLSGDTNLAGWYDDFAMLPKIMEVAGYRYQMADTSVLHAVGGSWAQEVYEQRARAAEAARRRLYAELDITEPDVAGEPGVVREPGVVPEPVVGADRRPIEEFTDAR